MTEKGWPHVAKPCGGAMWWHGHVSHNGEAIEVWLWCIRQRGGEGKSSGAQELARGEVMEGYPQPWPSAALLARRWGKF